VVDEQENNVGLLDRGLGFGEGYVLPRFQFGWKLFDVRLDRENCRFRKLFSQSIDDLSSRAFAQIVDIRLEGQSECRDLDLVDALRLWDELVQDEPGLRVVDIASSLDER